MKKMYNLWCKQCFIQTANCLLFLPISALRKTHMAYRKKYKALISALYFKIYGLYFSPFQMPEKQSFEKRPKSAVFGRGFGGSENEKSLSVAMIGE